MCDNIRSDSVWCQNEIPRLFTNDSVTSVQGVSKQQLISSYNILCEINEHDTNFAIGKAISDVPINNTDIDNYLKAVGKTEDTLGFFDKRILKLLEGKLSVLKDRFI